MATAVPVGSAIEIDGRGALVSNVSAHDASPQNFVSFVDLITDLAGRIRKRPGIGAVKGAVAGAPVKSMWEYTYASPTTKAVTRWLMRATDQIIQYWTGAAWSTMTLPTFSTTGTTTPTANGTWIFENAKNRCFAVNGLDDMIVFNGTVWHLAGCDGPISPAGYTKGGTFIATTGGAHTVTATQGSPTVTKTGGAAWDGAGPTYFMTGRVIEINGARYTISSIDGADTLTLTEGFKEVTYIGALYSIFYGLGDWDLSPKAAYAYYNPTTGHCSNIRAATLTSRNITEVTEQDQVAQTITWVNLVYDPSAYANGYTKIVLFRSPQNGNILQALSRTLVDINNSAAPGSTSWPETAISWPDTALDKFPAPETKLAKPPIGLTAIKYFAGRLWGVTGDHVYYSLADADVLGEYGVSEESWPATQYVIVNQTRGLKTIGGASGEDNLVVQTADGDWGITGYDRLTMFAYPLGTREGGSYHLGALGTRNNLIEFVGDKRLVGIDGTDFGLPIQDKLDTINESVIASVRLHRFSWMSRNFMMLSVPVTGAVKAQGTIVMTGLAVADETFRVGAQTFTWKAARGGTAGWVTIGATVAAACANIVAAVAADIPGTVVAATGSGTTVVITAFAVGAGGNATVLTEASTNTAVNGAGTLGGTTLGTDASTNPDRTYVFDVDQGKWYDWSVGFTAFATAHDSTSSALRLWASNAAGESFQLLVDGVWQDKAANFIPSFVTSHVRPFGLDASDELKALNAFVNDATATWGGELRLNEAVAAGGTAFTLGVTRHAEQSAQGREMDWVPELSSRVRASVFQLSFTFPTANADLVLEKLAILFASRQEMRAGAYGQLTVGAKKP